MESTKIYLINITGGIPLGLAYLSAYLGRLPGRDVQIISCEDNEQSRADIIEMIRRERPDVVGATVYTCHEGIIRRFMKNVKEIDESILTVVGGPHPTAVPNEMALDKYIDVVVRGEGEITFSELIGRFEKKMSYCDLEGIAYSLGGKAIVNTGRDLIPDLDMLPYPKWQNLPIESYSHPDYGHPRMNMKNFTNMLATRGCPFQCIFCGAADVWGRHLRKHSPARIVEEMRILSSEYGVRSVRFADSTFTTDRKWVLELCKILQASKIDIAWEANARADTIDEYLLKEMKKAKCMSLTVGVESGDENVLRICKKNQSLDQVRRAFKSMRATGMFSWAFFMIGLPGETKQSIMKTIEFALELDPDQVSICAFATPYPGTELYNIARNEAKIKNIPWEKYHHSKNILYIPEGLTEYDIEQGKKLFSEKLRPHERHKNRTYTI